jgi:hypothetical protein
MALARQVVAGLASFGKRLQRGSPRRYYAEHGHHAIVFVVGQVTVKRNIANDGLRKGQFDPHPPRPDRTFFTAIAGRRRGRYGYDIK